MRWLRLLSGDLVSAFFPAYCPGCGEVAGSAPLCGRCAAGVRLAPAAAVPPGLEACVALLSYEGLGREVIARAKYRRAHSSLEWLGGGVAEALDARLAPGLRAGLDTVTWAPTTDARRRERGFDQAARLARSVAAALGLPCLALLDRRPGPAQTGRAASERRRGPAMHAWPATRGRRVLLVDDVVTTGATMAEAARALRAAGAPSVVGAAAARTPRRP